MTVSFTQEIEDVVSTTLPAYIPSLIDNVFLSIPLLVKLIERDNVTLDGGSEIRQPFIFDQLPFGWYVGEDLHDVSVRRTQTAMRFDWKFAYGSVNLPMDQILMNSGSHAVTNLVQDKIQTAEMSVRQGLATSLFSDGTGFFGKEIVGLEAAIDDTLDYGGIARSSTEGAVLKSYVNAAGGQPTFDLIQLAMGKATFAPEKPDLAVTTQRIYDKIWSRAQSQQRFGAAPGLLGEVGFESIRVNGMDIVVDQKCPAGSMYLINTKWVKLVLHPQRRFEVDGPYKAPNQDLRIWKIYVALALIVQAPRLMSKLKNLDET